MHFLLALVLAFALVAGYGKPSDDHWHVTTVVPGSPAAAAGLAAGDKLVAINGVSMQNHTQAVTYIRAHPGEQATITVNRGGRIFETTARLADHNSAGEAVGFLGFGIQLELVRPSIGAAFSETGSLYVTSFKNTFTGIGHFFSPRGVTNYVSTLMNKPNATNPGSKPANEDRPISVIGLVDIGGDASQPPACPTYSSSWCCSTSSSACSTCSRCCRSTAAMWRSRSTSGCAVASGQPSTTPTSPSCMPLTYGGGAGAGVAVRVAALPRHHRPVGIGG